MQTAYKKDKVNSMQSRDLISVIMPVYNVKPYLSDCIKSVLNQSYSNFELILVDDGSTDGSGAVCDSFALKDDRVNVIHTVNGGLSSARNLGVKLAAGNYICFVDSDDMVSDKYLQTLYENVRKYDADVSFCGFLIFSDSYVNATEMQNTSVVRDKKSILDKLIETGPDCKSISIVVAWNKLIKREIAKKISFPEGKWHEDEFYINSLVEVADVFVETTAQLYFYRQRADSIVGDDNKNDERHLDIVDAFEERIEVYRRICDKNLYHKIISSYRNTILIQYANFKNTKKASKLWKRFVKSFFKYRNIDLRHIKGYLLFIINPNWYYRKYWG